MPNAPYFSQYVSPNIVIVPTECYYGPPKKPKPDRNVVLHQHPDSRVENCFKTPNLAVTNQTSENSATNNQDLKPSMQTSLQNEVPKSIARDVNKNSSAVDNNLNKTTKQSSSSWASNYLQSIGQLHKKDIKLNLSPHRKKGLTLKEDTSACTAGMNSKEETSNTSSTINDKERRTAITVNYKIPFKTSTHPTPHLDSKESKMPSGKTGTIVNQISTDTKHTKPHPTPKFDSKESKMPSEKTGTIVNQISTDTKHTKPLIRCDSKNITRDKITEHINLQKSNTENLKTLREFKIPLEKTGTIVNQISTDTKHTKPPIRCDSKNITRDKITEHINLQKSNTENLKTLREFKIPLEKTGTIVNQISTDTKHTKPPIRCDSKNITRDKITEHINLQKSNTENLKTRREFKIPLEKTGSIVNQISTDTNHTKPPIRCDSKNISRDKITEHINLQKSSTENLKTRPEFKIPLEKTGTIVNQIRTDTKHTKPPIRCDSKNITRRDKITEHITLQKSNTENLKTRPEFNRPESNKKTTKLKSSSRRNSVTKNEEKHEKDINKTKSKDLYSLKHLESKKKDKTNPESTKIAKTSKPAKTQESENKKSRHVNSASNSSTTHSKNERSTKPLKISNFFLNADTEKNLAASKSSKSSKISRDNGKEDNYVKNRKGSSKNKKDHSFSSTKNSLDGIKKKSKKCTLDTGKKSKSKSYNSKRSTTFSSTVKYGAFDDHRSSSKDPIKSVVQVTDNRLHHDHKIDENVDLRTKLSQKGLNHYFTKIQRAFNRYSIPNDNRENLIITVRNENDDDNERMDLKNVHEPSPDKDSRDDSVSREYKQIKLIINLICQQPSSQKPDKNENCGLPNEDLSFLDDFNVDEIVETLKHCENESIGAEHNVELDIELHAGLEKTNPVSLDIRENKINYSVPEITKTIVRSLREYSGKKCTEKLPQNLSHQATFVKTEKLTNDDTLDQDIIQETNSKIDSPDTLHNKNINDTNATENILKDQSSSNEIIQQLPTVNNVQLQETVNVVKIEYVEAMEAKFIKNSTKKTNSEHEVSTHETPVISNIKKEAGIEANDKSDKISNKDFATIGGKNNDTSILETIQIKSEPQSNSMLSNTLDDFDLREKLRKSGPRVKAVDNLPEITNVNLNCLHEDDDNDSDVTLVLSPPHFGDFHLIDLTNELDIENVSDIENYVKKEIETTRKTTEKLSDDLSLIDSSNELSIEKVCVSEIENYVKKEIETTGKTAESLLDDLSLIDSSNELSVEKVSVSEIENYVKKEIETTDATLVLSPPHFGDFRFIDLTNESDIENVSEIENYVKKEIETTGKTTESLSGDLNLIDSSTELSVEKVSVSEMENNVKKEIETTGKTAEKLSDDLSLIDSSVELSIEKVIEIENYVKKEIETTGKATEKLLDDLSLIDSSNKLNEKVSNAESHLDTEMKDVESTQNIPPDSVTKSTERTETIVSNTPNVSDASKTSEAAFSNTIKSEGSSNLEKCGKRKNEDQNESKSKIVKVEDCVSNTSVATVCHKKERKEQQQSKMSQSERMCEPDKLIAQNLEQRMLNYLREQYTVTSNIHKGAFSKMFHCQNSYGKSFAVKVLNSESDRYNLGVLKENMLMKMQKEIPNANYNCVHIYNGFSLKGFWCLLMEYYPHNLVQAMSKKARPFHINVVQNLARQLVAAVTVLRNYKIVHADICPRHILFNHANDKLKLCGFDGSYYIDCAKLAPNIGTVSYRAPEVILGFSAGYSIDVWSTALVIYEMATGIKLFPGSYNNDILYKQMCTLGNIPDDMVKKSLYKYSYFSGPTFMRKVGYGKKVVFVKEFIKSNRLRSTIFNQQRLHIANQSVLLPFRTEYCENLGTLCNLLEGMLVLHPNNRLPIEFVYSNPFVFDTFCKI